jgi:Flp pilus assembly protein TadB
MGSLAYPDHVRIGDRERDEAAKRLGDHAAAGRLTVAELEDRLERVHTAVYARDLRALEADLPAPRDRWNPGRRRAWARGMPVPALVAIAIAVVAVIAATHGAAVVVFGVIMVRRHVVHRRRQYPVLPG